MQANSGDPDQTPHSVVSGPGLHYLPMWLRQYVVNVLDCVINRGYYINADVLAHVG